MKFIPSCFFPNLLKPGSPKPYQVKSNQTLSEILHSKCGLRKVSQNALRLCFNMQKALCPCTKVHKSIKENALQYFQQFNKPQCDCVFQKLDSVVSANLDFTSILHNLSSSFSFLSFPQCWMSCA